MISDEKLAELEQKIPVPTIFEIGSIKSMA